MEPITFRVDEEVADAIDAEAEEEGVSRAEYLRQIVRNRHESDRIREEYEQRLDELETNLERVRREKRQILDQREEHTELVRQVEQERSLAERKARAGLATRLKWLVTGMDEEDEP